MNAKMMGHLFHFCNSEQQQKKSRLKKFVVLSSVCPTSSFIGLRGGYLLPDQFGDMIHSWALQRTTSLQR